MLTLYSFGQSVVLPLSVNEAKCSVDLWTAVPPTTATFPVERLPILHNLRVNRWGRLPAGVIHERPN
jgi:hypothetical protein